MRIRSALALALSIALAAGVRARADQTLAAEAAELRLTEGLVLRDAASWGRRVINPDAVAGAIAAGKLGSPKEGDTLKRPDALRAGDSTWEPRAASEGGGFTLPRGSYLLCTVRCDADRVMMLEASGHSMVYVNAEPHAGDPYSHGYMHVPVALHAGANQFVFAHAGRGPLKARLIAPPAQAFVIADDLTLPNVISERPEEYLLGVPIVNASPAAVTVTVTLRQGSGAAREQRVDLPPLGVLKAPLRASLSGVPGTDVRAELVIKGAGRDGTPPPAEISRTDIVLQARRPTEVHSRAYLSEIDGSVQYVALTPPSADPPTQVASADGGATPSAPARPGLVLSLHGAAVEARGQAPCYAPKADFVIVCPTNRRPYGFDWEDWGRVDALEAMDHARRWFNTDPSRQYLTGHSMGGHGAWQLGVLLPERFAAVAPSAGWLTFDTYAQQRGEPTEAAETPISAMFRRATASSDTLGLMGNLAGRGVYILHGDKDDNVPVGQARRAKRELEKLGVPFTYFEQPGVGHWWDDDPTTPGTACVDWAPMFEMFRERALPGAGEQSEFHVRSLQPGVALAPGDGVRILRGERPGLPSKADVYVDRAGDGPTRVRVECDNVSELCLGAQVIGDAPTCTVEIGGRTIKAARRGSHVLLVKRPGAPWQDGGTDPAFGASASAEVCPPLGPFKNAFTNRFVLVYATRGSSEENAWSLARARYDAEQWWYRGNGLAVMLPDTQFLARLDSGQPLGNAVIYGNSDTNAAAARLTPAQAVQVSRSKAVVGGRAVEGSDIGVLAVGTFQGPAGPSMYALIGGTGLAGCRATDRMPYLLAGVGIPDVCVLRTSFWSSGAAGIECAGFWNPDFGADQADVAWKDPAAPKPVK